MKVHQTLVWLNLLSLGTKGLKPHQQSVCNQNQLQMTTHYCAILTLSHQGAGCNCILSVSRRCVWCAARQGKESRLLLVAYPSASPIGGDGSDVSTLYLQLHGMTSCRHGSRNHHHTQTDWLGNNYMIIKECWRWRHWRKQVVWMGLECSEKEKPQSRQSAKLFFQTQELG